MDAKTRQERSRAYKEVRLQQLRSFCETARLGSFTAAATSLDLAQPTVWEQVHALERTFEAILVEPFGRGCRLTEEGRLLAELAGPLINGIDRLKSQFDEMRGKLQPRLVITTTPRILLEDLPECAVEFERRFPDVQLTLREVRDEEVFQDLASGATDLGFTGRREPAASSPWVCVQPLYKLEVILITPVDHPLARKRRVRLDDLRNYPIVNAPTSWADNSVNETLQRLGVFDVQARRVEAFYAAAIRRYVQIGFGIGLIGRLPTHKPLPGFHERVMSQYFGPQIVYLITKKGVPLPSAAQAFADTVRNLLSNEPARR